MSVRDVVQAAAGALGESTYIEDVFSTYLYTGTGSTQTITNGIDLAGEGGLVWIKNRTTTTAHSLWDTERGTSVLLETNSTSANIGNSLLSSFNSDGFTTWSGAHFRINEPNYPYASWTFRKAEKFFDVVTFEVTRDGSNQLSSTSPNVIINSQIVYIKHSLKSAPRIWIQKNTTDASSWYVRSTIVNGYGVLNNTNAFAGSTAFTSSDTQAELGNYGYFQSGTHIYVAYLFAHNAGGFGDDGSENVISCGSYTATNGVALNVNLGFEPAWIIVKKTNSTGDWWIQDNMRGWGAVNSGDSQVYLKANSSATESIKSTDGLILTSTGFTVPATSGDFNSNGTYIYIAIRRGPMKPPESGTEVFSPVATTASGNTKITTDFPLDLQIHGYRTASTPNNSKVMTRLTGVNTSPVNTTMPYLITSSTGVEALAAYTRYWDNTGFEISSGLGGGNSVYWNFRRAPGFMDVVCYTGTGVARTVNHNLGVAPELMIVKSRSNGLAWQVYSASLGPSFRLLLNSTSGAVAHNDNWNLTAPTASVFSLGTQGDVNFSGYTYVAYLFATVAGVSKVGSYTGTAATQQINCGFTGGARFVLIKRTDSTGAWYVWDSARGIVAGNDPYLLLNSTAAEVTNTDYVDTYSAGFEISSTAPAAINASGGTFIFLAIA